MEANMGDPEIEAAAGAMQDDVSEQNDGEEPTIEQQGTMTPGKESVEEANAQGVNPDN
jgi:hypothetical protein